MADFSVKINYIELLKRGVGQTVLEIQVVNLYSTLLKMVT